MKNYMYVTIMKTDSNREYLKIHGLHMNMVGKKVFTQQIATTGIALLQGEKEDPISLCSNDYYNETDNNVICSNTHTNDDQQNITWQDDTIRMSQRHRKPEVTRNDDFYYKKKSSYRKYCNSNNGAITSNRVDVILSSKISSWQQTTNNEAFMLYH